MKTLNVIVGLVFVVIICQFAVATTKWFDLEKTQYSFEKYVQEFRRKYSDDEERQFRKAIFDSNLENILIHNKDETKTWKEGVNQWTDRTTEERSQVLGLRKELLYDQKFNSQKKVAKMQSHSVSTHALPTDIDWRQAGIISAVKDQGMCGSCWTFGTAETIESYWALATGNLEDLSEQEILDCVPNPDQCGGTGGCNGGTPELAYVGIQKLGGLAAEWTYPYLSYFTKAFECKMNGSGQITPMVQLNGYTTLPANQYAPVLNHVANVGPLAINVDASTWFQYETGVYNGCNQTDPDIDHVVQLVGYGTDPQLGDYWLVRNSWNPTWGESGYIRLMKSSTPVCGNDTQPSDGTGCKNGPPSVTVCGTCGILFDTSFPTISVN